MLRKSLVLNGGGPSPKKRGSIVGGKNTRKSSLNSSKVGIQAPRESLRVNISPERITNICEYVKYFISAEKENLSLLEIEQLILQPKSTHDKPDIHEAALHSMSLFLQLLQKAQMDYYDWFEFVLSRNGSSLQYADKLTLQEFSNEVNRLSNDLRVPGIPDDALKGLFFLMIGCEKETETLDHSLLDSSVKKYYLKEQYNHMLNSIASELALVSIYMRKMNITLQSILDITGSETMEVGLIKVIQLDFLLSSLILMYEIYVTEYGIPMENDLLLFQQQRASSSSQQGIAGSPSKNNIISPRSSEGGDGILSPQLSGFISKRGISGISDLTPTPYSNNDLLNSRQKSINTGSGSGDFDKDVPPPRLSSMMSFKSFKIPTTIEITTNMSSFVNTMKKSFSFRSSHAPILPSENSKYNFQQPNSSPTAAVTPTAVTDSGKKKNLPVEVNSDFVKHLDWEERTKVINLVKHLREGESGQNGGINGSSMSIKREPSKEEAEDEQKSKVSFFHRYSVTRTSASASAKSGSVKHHSGVTETAGYIVISADENDDHDDHLLLNETIDPSPKNKHGSIDITTVTAASLANNSGGRRKSMINSTNRMENMKNDMIESFNRRIGAANQLMQKNR
jgi:hypothetical protein